MIYCSGIVCPGCGEVGEGVGRPHINIGIEDVENYIRNLMNGQSAIERHELDGIRNILGLLNANLFDGFDNDAQFFDLPTLHLSMRVDGRGILLTNFVPEENVAPVR